MNQPIKNQHYISKSLLEEFAENKKLAEVLLKEKKIYYTASINSMSERFLYEQDGLKINTVENYFSNIERVQIPKIKNILNSIKSENFDIDIIKSDIEELLPIFLIFYYRSKALLTEFCSINKKDKIPLLSKKILNQKYISLLSESIILGYKFAIIKASDGFLLSDQYISTAALKIKTQFFEISNRHIGLVDTLILIPLSSEYYIAYWNSSKNFNLIENQLNYLTTNQTIEINKCIINNSYIKCVGKDKLNIEDVLGYYRDRYPSQVFSGGNGFYSGAIKKKEVFYYKIDNDAWDMFKNVGFIRFKGVGRNDLCKCNSGKKFKKCCSDVYSKVKVLNTTFAVNSKLLAKRFIIKNVKILESPIDYWGNYENLNESYGRTINNKCK